MSIIKVSIKMLLIETYIYIFLFLVCLFRIYL